MISQYLFGRGNRNQTTNDMKPAPVLGGYQPQKSTGPISASEAKRISENVGVDEQLTEVWKLIRERAELGRGKAGTTLELKKPVLSELERNGFGVQRVNEHARQSNNDLKYLIYWNDE